MPTLTTAKSLHEILKGLMTSRLVPEKSRNTFESTAKELFWRFDVMMLSMFLSGSKSEPQGVSGNVQILVVDADTTVSGNHFGSTTFCFPRLSGDERYLRKWELSEQYANVSRDRLLNRAAKQLLGQWTCEAPDESEEPTSPSQVLTLLSIIYLESRFGKFADTATDEDSVPCLIVVVRGDDDVQAVGVARDPVLPVASIGNA